MLHIDIKYIELASPFLRNFKKVNKNVWNFSCPICGDSTKHKTKARGYFFQASDGLVFKCHNCGIPLSVEHFLQSIDPNLAEQYRFDMFEYRMATRRIIEDVIQEPKKEEVSITQDALLDDLVPASKNDECLKFLISRKIPTAKWKYFYYTANFKKYVNSIIPNKFKTLEHDHPRIIIPFLNEHGKVIAFQGRVMPNAAPSSDSVVKTKYITIKIGEDNDKIFGLDSVNYGKKVYVVEGPIDSMFLDNAVASAGSSLLNSWSEQIITNVTFVFDNEPHNRDICALMRKTVKKGGTIAIWPETVKEKDINDMILSGTSPTQLKKQIDDNTFKGIEAEFRLSVWAKS